MSRRGVEYPVERGIPRFVVGSDDDQGQTSSSFGYKWSRRSSWESAEMREFALDWLLRRYGFDSARALREHLDARGPVLDLGCGGGYSSSLYLEQDGIASRWVGVDISSAIDIAADRLGHVPNTGFVQADAMRLPFASGTFGSIISEGVLHHTPSTREALAAAADVLRDDGELHFYVYRRKSPLREYSDDLVRVAIADLPPEEAWERLRPLTGLGRALAELGATVTIPEDIPYLQIPAGTYDVQRLFYWHVAKLFWNEKLSFEENHHVNFDWYHPAYAHRQTEAEIRAWCDDIGLRIERFHAEESGFTVRARKAGR